MDLVVLSGSGNPALGAAIARELSVPLGSCLLERFPDGEIHVELGTEVGEREVYLVQPTGPVVSEHLLELLLLADACRRAGAVRTSAVIPYFGYARGDRRTREGQPVASRVVADLLGAAGFARVVAVDLHAASLEVAFPMPLVHLSAMPLLVHWARAHAGDRSIIVSPDLGAVKLAQRYARHLGLPLAFVHKARRSGSEVSVQGVVGPVRGRRPMLVDDMVSTGGTIAAAAAALLEQGCLPEITVIATHGVLVGNAAERLQSFPLRKLVTTDSLPQPQGLPFDHDVVSLSPLLSEAIARLRRGGSLVPLGLGD